MAQGWSLQSPEACRSDCGAGDRAGQLRFSCKGVHHRACSAQPDNELFDIRVMSSQLQRRQQRRRVKGGEREAQQGSGADGLWTYDLGRMPAAIPLSAPSVDLSSAPPRKPPKLRPPVAAATLRLLSAGSSCAKSHG